MRLKLIFNTINSLKISSMEEKQATLTCKCHNNDTKINEMGPKFIYMFMLMLDNKANKTLLLSLYMYWLFLYMRNLSFCVKLNLFYITFNKIFCSLLKSKLILNLNLNIYKS